MAAVAVITAIYDGYDALKPAVPQNADTDWVLVTDSPPDDPLGWRVIHDPRPGVRPCRAAKRPKFFPWEYTDAPASVWIDASYTVTSGEFAGTMLGCADPIAQYAHPQRSCLFAEAEVSVAMAKYAGEPIAGQAKAYAEAGHPRGWGLWTCGIIARRHTPGVKALGEAWAAEVGKWSVQDQVSEPFVLRNLGLRPSPLPGVYDSSTLFGLNSSHRHFC